MEIGKCYKDKSKDFCQLGRDIFGKFVNNLLTSIKLAVLRRVARPATVAVITRMVSNRRNLKITPSIAVAMSKTVLLAEDEPNIVESLSFLLERAGFEIKVATDGRQALESALEQQPDVLVLDLMLPELDGYEVLRQLRANPKGVNLPVLMLTAKGQRIDRETALECGADLFMTKPFANAEITAAVTRLASQPRG